MSVRDVDHEQTARPDSDRVVFLDQALWSALDGGLAGDGFSSAFLTLQCRMLREAHRGALLMREDGTTLSTTARWPNGDMGSAELTRTVALCHEHRRGIANIAKVVQGRETGRTSFLAYPVLIDGIVQAVVGVETAAKSESAVRDLMGSLHWGAAWLELVIRRLAGADLSERLDSTAAALEILSVALAAKCFEDQARDAATEIANRIGAARVAIGWVHGRAVRLTALSHGAAFNRRMELASRLAAAMDETFDQAQTLCFPTPEGGRVFVTKAHAAIATEGTSVLSVPLVSGSRIVGVALAEFDRASILDQRKVDLLEAVATLAGPALEWTRKAERPLAIHSIDSARDVLTGLFGPGHLVLKLATLATLSVIAFFSLFHVEYRLNGRATVEGEVRRTIAAAIDGYVASEHARAGQTVKKDTVLATLDATEFTLQRLRWIAVRQQHQLELSKNLAAGQRADVNILRAQVDEAGAQIALLDDEIKRTRIVAPFDGIVLSGDLSQSVGAPVQRAQVLFEVAPLDAYRVVIRIPDTEIGRVRPGSKGSVVLSALPDDVSPFTVTNITPVAEVSEGENAFKVEGKLDRVSDRLRPNMEGVAKVEVGQKLLIWVWTHRLIVAARLAIWSWSP